MAAHDHAQSRARSRAWAWPVGGARAPWSISPSRFEFAVPARLREWARVEVAAGRLLPWFAVAYGLGIVIYFTVENVRAFGPEQQLDLSDKAGHPAPWTLLLGENGVGKTTLLQCLARMHPFPAFKTNPTKARKEPPKDEGDPEYVEPELLQHENDEIERFFRFGSKITTKIAADISTYELTDSVKTLKKKKLTLSAEFKSDKGIILGAETTQQRFTLPKPGPLVIGYGAARYIGHANRARVEKEDSTLSLFKDSTDLYDAEEILADLRFAALDSRDRASKKMKRRTKDEKRLTSVLEAVAAWLLARQKIQDD